MRIGRLGSRHLRLDVVQQPIQRALDHRPQILALRPQVQLVHLRVQNGPDDRPPLVRAQNPVADVLQLRQVGAQIAPPVKPVQGSAN